MSYIRESDAAASVEAILARMEYGATMATGDANNDGVVSASDVVLLIDYLYDSGHLINEHNTDVNGDCVVNVLDLVYLIGHVHGGQPLESMPCSSR